ncbi:MAG TPA: chemotaxis protein CheA [Syntrophothermus lipocalidus]|nr:chemotaxis protein CheA [Syntrophothermus lipocalidus]
MNMDMSQYLDLFLDESREHVDNMNQKLLELEKKPDDLSVLNEIFRSAHTLKGMSSTMGFDDMADLTHHMENVLDDLKEGELSADTFTVDVLFRCLDRLQLMLDNIREGGSGGINSSDLVDLLDQIRNRELVEEKETGVQHAAAIAEPVSPEALEPEPSEPPIVPDMNEYELAVIREAFARQLNVFYIKVLVDPDCLMKQVRAFMVFKALEEDGDVIKSDPPAQELDEGRYGEGFEVILVSKAEEDDIRSRLEQISEIRVADIQKLNAGAFYTAPPSVKTGQVTTTESSKQPTKDSDIAGDSGPTQERVQKIRQTVRVDIQRLDNLMNLVGELVINKGRLEQIGQSQKITELNETIEQIDRITTDLQNEVMKVRMVPIKQVFNRFPRMVRDLAHELEKEVNFILEGEETELDRTVIDEIGDPLMHLLRNAIDHGLEIPEERVALGKPRIGLVKLSARHEGNNVFIEVIDDGKGISVQDIKRKALEKGMITPKESEQMDADSAISLLFRPGFSTAENVTDVSGRGVGLDVVKSKIESLNGDISVEFQPGKGTIFRIRLPLTLAIIQALLVGVGDETYAIPLGSVDETTMLSRDEIKLVQNQEVVLLRGSVLPLARLHQLLQVPKEQGADDSVYVVVVRKGDKRTGLVCDNLIGQQDIVIKSLGKLLSGIGGLAGATILGDGQVALILDVGTLF